MNPAWIGVIGALGGVLVGAFAQWWLAQRTFKREKAWALNEEKRRRLEHLYEALEEVASAYGLSYGEALYTVGTQRAPPRDAPRPKIPWARLKMLVNLYAPNLKTQLAVVEDAGRNAGSAFGTALMESSLDKAKNDRLIAAVDTAHRRLTQATDSMRATIVDRSLQLSESAVRHADQRLQE